MSPSPPVWRLLLEPVRLIFPPLSFPVSFPYPWSLCPSTASSFGLSSTLRVQFTFSVTFVPLRTARGGQGKKKKEKKTVLHTVTMATASRSWASIAQQTCLLSYSCLTKIKAYLWWEWDKGKGSVCQGRAVFHNPPRIQCAFLCDELLLQMADIKVGHCRWAARSAQQRTPTVYYGAAFFLSAEGSVAWRPWVDRGCWVIVCNRKWMRLLGSTASLWDINLC